MWHLQKCVNGICKENIKRVLKKNKSDVFTYYGKAYHMWQKRSRQVWGYFLKKGCFVFFFALDIFVQTLKRRRFDSYYHCIVSLLVPFFITVNFSNEFSKERKINVTPSLLICVCIFPLLCMHWMYAWKPSSINPRHWINITNLYMHGNISCSIPSVVVIKKLQSSTHIHSWTIDYDEFMYATRKLNGYSTGNHYI